MPDVSCVHCGAHRLSSNTFCPRCGTPYLIVDPVTPAAAGAYVVPPPPATGESAETHGLDLRTWRSGVTWSGLPAEFWAVVAIFAVVGARMLGQALGSLPDVIDLFADHPRFGLLVLVVVVIRGVVGGALMAVAWLIYRRDRIARPLAYVVTGVVVSMFMFSDEHVFALLLSALATAAAGAALHLLPAVDEALASSPGPPAQRPAWIGVAQVSLVVWVALLVLAGIVNLLAGAGARYATVGCLLGATAVGAALSYRPLGRGRRTARLAVTGVALAAVVLLLMSARGDGLAPVLGLAVALTCAVWLPREARCHFGAVPPAPRDGPTSA
jgi:hypothetical protein